MIKSPVRPDTTPDTPHTPAETTPDLCDVRHTSAEVVDSSESAVSHQLRLLRSLRLVRSRRSGRLVFYRLDDEHIRRLLDQGRRHIEEDASVRGENVEELAGARAPREVA